MPDAPRACPCPSLSNVGGRALRDPEGIRADLARSVEQPVRWHDATALLFELGVRLFVDNHGVRVVGVSPGDMTNERGIEFLRRRAGRELGDPERWREHLSHLPGGRAATSEDVADAIVFLASPPAGYVSGTVLTIDGG